MKDRCERNIDYLRISVTDRCNLRCVYCMPEEGIDCLAHGQILTYEEIIRLCEAASQLGIKKIKLTGGEPLIRRNLPALISRIKQIRGITSVTLTTNGILLKEQLPDLLKAGLDAVNISIDTLDPEKYHQMTRWGQVDKALDGLHCAIMAQPSIPVKVNCVLYDCDKENLIAMAGLAKKYPVHVRFIEMMPIGLGRECGFCSEDTVVEILDAHFGSLKPVDVMIGNGPCHYYEIDGFSGKIGFISAVTHKFCSKCNRIRLTASGFLKTCLQYDAGVDLKALMRGGCDDKVLTDAMEKAIYNKPVSHHFATLPQDADKTQSDEHLSMFQIGG